MKNNGQILIQTYFALACMMSTVLMIPNAEAQEDIAHVRGKEFQVDDNPKLKYVLIGDKKKTKPPEDGYRVLVVLPGGDGSGEFTPFVKRIYAHGLSEDYVIVQLIAPKWSSKQQIVWPTDGLQVRNMRMSTEEFARRAIEDISKRAKIDKQHVYSLGWSSGGPAAYAMGLMEDTPFTGTFAAMSVFKPNQVPVENAKDRPFFILHSQEDRVCPFRIAKDAEGKLKEQGGKVKFVTYDGGHGWRGDVYGNISQGITWLDNQNL